MKREAGTRKASSLLRNSCITENTVLKMGTTAACTLALGCSTRDEPDGIQAKTIMSRGKSSLANTSDGSKIECQGTWPALVSRKRSN